MASDNEDDYLSDKFLLESATATTATNKPLTYAERRKQARKQSEIKNAQSRIKSRREREAEAREEGLRQSLFERAEAEKQELGAKNKAMDMMLRMGFKPGESLGRSDSSGISGAEPAPSTVPAPAPAPPHLDSAPTNIPLESFVQSENVKASESQHRTVPLSVDVWAGKQGVGLGKRAPSPGTVERTSKAARIDEEMERETYRSRTREAFEERRAIGRLSAASRTLIGLDEKAGIQFNVLSLNPQEPETFPPELVDALFASSDVAQNVVVSLGVQESESERLRKQMQLDALQPLETLAPDGDGGDGGGAELPKKDAPLPLSLSEETIDEAGEFLQMDARARLKRVLAYLREKYYYCFWCGTQYSDREDLDGNCPGEDEEVHD